MARTRPAMPDTPKAVSAANFTCFTVANFPATRRIGPTRTSSVPRTPSA